MALKLCGVNRRALSPEPRAYGSGLRAQGYLRAGTFVRSM